MNIGHIQRFIGMFLMAFAVSMLPPVAIELHYGDGSLEPFLLALGINLVVGLVLWFPNRRVRTEMRTREGFLAVTLFWVVLGAAASLPFVFADTPRLSITDALFEAVSGLTTTGATILVGIDGLSHSMLWYRQQLQWIGGFSIAVVAMAVLPVLGIGGMQLYRGESTGPTRQDRLLPRLQETMRVFLRVYLIISAACALAYFLAGMSPFDAVAHAFSTVSSGGFSTHDANFAWFQSDLIEIICMVFMIAGGISFALHFRVLQTLDIGKYLRHAETRTFLVLVLIISAIAAVYLVYRTPQASFLDQVLNAAFQVVSIMTTTGFVTEHYADWPGFLPVLLIFASIMGACAGSTTGGMKTIRFMMVYKQGLREITRMIHPSVASPVKLGRRIVSDQVMEAIWGFFAAYTLIYVLLMLLFLGTGLDQVSAFSAVAATLNNLGPGLGEVSVNFIEVSDFGKWVGIAGMLLGRVEIFTILVLLTPEFWRH